MNPEIGHLPMNPTLTGQAELLEHIVYSANGQELSLILPWTIGQDRSKMKRVPLILFVQGSAWTTPARNAAAMQKLFEDAGEWPRPIVFDFDEGASFDEHYNCAFQKAWDRGADCILSMGADMPALTKVDIFLGFQELHKLWDNNVPGIVLSPDQEMGVSVVGWSRTLDFDHSGVFYNQQGLTVLPAYIGKCRERGLRAVHLPAIPDVDTLQDLQHNITLVEALNYCAQSGDDVCPPWRTYGFLAELGLAEVRVMPNSLMDPREHIDK